MCLLLLSLTCSLQPVVANCAATTSGRSSLPKSIHSRNSCSAMSSSSVSEDKCQQLAGAARCCCGLCFCSTTAALAQTSLYSPQPLQRYRDDDTIATTSNSKTSIPQPWSMSLKHEHTVRLQLPCLYARGAHPNAWIQAIHKP